LTRLNSEHILFTPQLIDSGDGRFSYERIEWEHFKDVYGRSSFEEKRQLVLRLLDRAYALDNIWIIHGELIRPFTNILVTPEQDISIIDFERGAFGDTSGKNMRSLSQWLLWESWITLKDAKHLWTIESNTIYTYLSHEIKSKHTKTLDKSEHVFWTIGLWFIFLVCIDQITKYFFFDLELWSEFLLLTPVFNTGIWWSLPIPIQLVIVLTFGICLGVFYARKHKHLDSISTLLIASGAVWNLIDRVWLSGVRDFIDLQYRPIFNFADIYLSIALIYLIYYQFKLPDANN
jgi:lipoprotein signal peptidase